MASRSPGRDDQLDLPGLELPPPFRHRRLVARRKDPVTVESLREMGARSSTLDYATHPNRAFRGAFRKGLAAGAGGLPYSACPYLAPGGGAAGSWRDAFARAWATGWYGAFRPEATRDVGSAAVG